MVFRGSLLVLVFSAAMSLAQSQSSSLDRLDPAKIPEELRLPNQPSEIVAILHKHTRGVAGLAFSPDGKTLVSAGWDNKLIWWRVRGSEFVAGDTAAGSPSGVAFSPDGKTLISGGADAHVHLWKNGKQARPLAGHQNRPFAVAFSPCGKLLASGCGEPTVRVWKLDEDEPEAWAVLANETNPAVGVSSLSFSFDGKYLAMGHHAGKSTLRIWDVGGNIMEEIDIPDAMARLVAFSPKEPLLAFSGNAEIRLWDFKEGKARPRKSLPAHSQKVAPGSVKALTFSPDGKSLASCGQDRRLVVWDVPRDEKRLEWVFPNQGLALTFAPDGRHLALGNQDGTIYVLRVPAVKMK
ncbi:MAG: WD40 repeat domain-containing protein [Planctomycetes bacterium]|nr:WD40 repeat domain-containing protein [Planctomycetota bacterium]